MGVCQGSVMLVEEGSAAGSSRPPCGEGKGRLRRPSPDKTPKRSSGHGVGVIASPESATPRKGERKDSPAGRLGYSYHHPIVNVSADYNIAKVAAARCN